MDIVINYWAVLGAVIVAVVLATIWYGPLFGKQWMKIVGISHEDMEEAKKKGMWRTYALMFIGTYAMAFVLAHVIAVFSGTLNNGIGGPGVTAGLWMWIGFVAPVSMANVLWENRPWKYWFITSGYYLVSLILMGIVLTF